MKPFSIFASLLLLTSFAAAPVSAIEMPKSCQHKLLPDGKIKIFKVPTSFDSCATALTGNLVGEVASDLTGNPDAAKWVSDIFSTANSIAELASPQKLVKAALWDFTTEQLGLSHHKKSN